MSYHVPVMAEACVQSLLTDPNGVYVDATFGGGGHSRQILAHLGANGRLLAFDQDPDAAVQAADIQDERLTFIPANFRHLAKYLRLYGITELTGLFADLGVSSHQFDVPERGFSFRYDAPLDMRMARQGGQTAGELLAEVSPEELQQLLGTYGEVRNARTLAQHIVQQRTQVPLRTTGDLVRCVEPCIRGNRPKYLAQVFQALRMAVNDEIGALEALLTGAQRYVRPGGRLVVLSYHSGEDRLVKNLMKTGRLDGRHDADDYGRIRRPWTLITKKPITANPEEISQNSRARSAKLRVAERNDENNK